MVSPVVGGMYVALIFDRQLLDGTGGGFRAPRRAIETADRDDWSIVVVNSTGNFAQLEGWSGEVVGESD